MPAHSLVDNDEGFQTDAEIEREIEYVRSVAPPSNDDGIFQFIHDGCNAILLLLNVAMAAMRVCDQYESRKENGGARSS